MTILPTKKPTQQKSDSDGNDHGERHSQHSGENLELFNYSSRNSPPRWVAGSASGEKRSAHGSNHVFESAEGGPSHSKRRHRASPHRSLRKFHRVCNNQANFTGPSTSQGSKSPSVDRSQALKSVEEDHSGYNSGDEYDRPAEFWTADEYLEREALFEHLLREKGFAIKKMKEDGACLFRAVADQVYGDEEMHLAARRLCMDYMEKNADYYSQYVTEEFSKYVERKRCADSHGNHIEIQALSEMFNRPIEVYHYSAEPINIFHGNHKTDNEPIRLSYHRNVHYNSITDPYKPTVGVGLGFPQFKAGIADKSLIREAILASESVLLEQQMLEDKLRATDWEATNEALEEQVARESYLEWLRENERRTRGGGCSATTTAAQAATATAASATATSSSSLAEQQLPALSANACSSSRQSPARCVSVAAAASAASAATSVMESAAVGNTTPLRNGSKSPNCRRSGSKSPRDSNNSSLNSSELNSSSVSNNSSTGNSPKAGSSGLSAWASSSRNSDSFQLVETASFITSLPLQMFGFEDYSEKDDNAILARVLAESQQEYLDSLRRRNSDASHSNNDS